MMKTAEFQEVLDKIIAESIEVTGVSSVAGGSINNAYRLETNRGDFFVKSNRSDLYPGMFEAEQKGLQLLLEAGEIGIPTTHGITEIDYTSYLVMDYVEPGSRDDGFWQELGSGLARLHGHHSDRYGSDHDNYMGSLQQVNKWEDSWSDFFAHNRLIPQTRMAMDRGLLTSRDSENMDRVCAELPNIFPEETPSLVHGDLWSGNYLPGADGKAYIIDPAAYYGNREIDIAMSKLFGGFDRMFYEAYNDTYPLQDGWQERVEICNLYPLLIHVNLFGGGYVGSVRQVINRFE